MRIYKNKDVSTGPMTITFFNLAMHKIFYEANP